MESSRDRTAQFEKLQVAVESGYALLYGALVVAPPPIGNKTKPIGVRLKKATPEIAEAWIDLAEDDPKVKRMLLQLTGISGWGKVVGLHLFVIGGDIPGITQQFVPKPQQGQESQEGTPSDIEALMAMAEFLQQGAAQERQPQGNGPAPQQKGRPMPPRQQEQQPRPQQPPQQPPAPEARPKAGIPSPRELGVEIADLPVEFPAGDAQDVKG